MRYYLCVLLSVGQFSFRSEKELARICFGEFDWKDGRSKRAFLRSKFLESLATHAPDACEILYSQVVPLYLRHAAANGLDPKRIDAAFITDDLLETSAEPAALIDGLQEWVWDCNLRHNNAPADWCVEQALQTVRLWAFSAVPPAGWFFDSVASGGVRLVISPEIPHLPDYVPVSEWREWYFIKVQRLLAIDWGLGNVPLKAIRQSVPINAYCDRVEAAFEATGNYVRVSTSEKRSSLEDHMKWTVLYQVKGDSFDKIGGSDNKAKIWRAVTDAENENGILKIIGLTQRGKFLNSLR